MNQNAKERLYGFVDRCRADLGIPYCVPINTLRLCAAYPRIDVIQHTFSTHGLCGAAYAGDKKDAIILNSARTDAEQNFDCGHELIHLARHRERNGGIFQCFSESQNSFIEWEANEGSAQLIVPYQDFIPRFSECFSSHKERYAPDVLAEHYRVTSRVIEIRIESLSYEIDQYRRGIPVTEIKLYSRNQLTKMGIRPTRYVAACVFAGIDFNAAQAR